MKYSDSHEWISISGEEGCVGISQHAQEELGEIVFVQLPEVGKELKAGEVAAVCESTKAASDIYTPVSGVVVAINQEVVENPSLINQDPEKGGWLFKISLKVRSELDTLLDHEQYHHLIS